MITTTKLSSLSLKVVPKYAALVHNLLGRSYSSTSTNVLSQEVRIPVPWGHIAGKWWGPQDKKPIIVFHGWQDNCGSFDLLIPQLPKHLSYLALDFPGHGYSSRLPVGMFYFHLNGVMLIRRLQNYFQWDKLTLMGHSLGAITSYTFGGFYPESVEFMMCIDGLSPLINPKRLARVTKSMDAFLKYDALLQSNKEPPSYSMDKVIAMMHKGTMESVDVDKCKYILERNVKESKEKPGMFYFDRDPRLKAGPLMNWPLDDLLDHARRIDFPMFITKSEKSPVTSNHEIYKQVIGILTKNPETEFHEIKGTHHGHLNTPELFSNLIGNFIAKVDKTDRTLNKDVFAKIAYP